MRTVSLCGEHLTEPGHICAFFDSSAEKYDVLAPYMAQGLDAGDRVINVVDASARVGHLDELRRAGVSVDAALGAGQLDVLTSEETYLRDGIQDLEGMLDLVAGALEASRRAGKGVRTCGDMSWIARSTMPMERVLEYESKVNYFLPDFDCTLICSYDLNGMSAKLLSDILATHPAAIVKGRLRPNPYYVHPDEYLQMLRSRATPTQSAAAI